MLYFALGQDLHIYTYVISMKLIHLLNIKLDGRNLFGEQKNIKRDCIYKKLYIQLSDYHCNNTAIT